MIGLFWGTGDGNILREVFDGEEVIGRGMPVEVMWPVDVDKGRLA